MSIHFGLAIAIAAYDGIPGRQLVTRIGDKEVFAPAMPGMWSKSWASFRDEHSTETFVISETRLEGYEWDATLLKATPVIEQSGPRKGNRGRRLLCSRPIVSKPTSHSASFALVFSRASSS